MSFEVRPGLILSKLDTAFLERQTDEWVRVGSMSS